MFRTIEESQPPEAYKTWKIMSPAQAKELARRLYYQLGDKAEARASSIQATADEFVAHSIIAGYMNRPMMSDEDVRAYIIERLGLEE